MASYAHAFPPAPAHFSAPEAAAYEKRRQLCLLVMGNYANDIEEGPNEYFIMLYRGVLFGRWGIEDVSVLLSQHDAEFASGNRRHLPTERLYDIRRDYFQEGEERAVELLGAMYDVWQANYTPAPAPMYGPYLAGQEPAPVVSRQLTQAEQNAVVDQAEELLGQRLRQWIKERRPKAILSPQMGQYTLSGFERAVLSSYLTREINSGTANELLVAHRGKDGWWSGILSS